MRPLVAAALAAVVVTGCSTTVSGTPTWPGARLERVALSPADFPPGVEYGRISEQPGQPDNFAGPAPMLSRPQGCANGLTEVIAADAERGPGSAVKYSVIYDGARIVMTVLTSPLNLDALAAEAARCEKFDTYFDRNSKPIPITTTKLEGARPNQLVYQQTMALQGLNSSVYMSFENVPRGQERSDSGDNSGTMSVFGIAFPTTQLAAGQQQAPKASLPQTFTEIAQRQAQRIRDS